MTNPKRILFVAALLALAIGPLAAQSDRAKQFSMKIKCMCRGCDMPAGICSHPGGAFSGPCSTAKGMMAEVDQHLAKGESEDQILNAFVAEYGTGVYVEPPKQGFGLVAWIMPVFYILIGLGLVAFFIKKWTKPSRIATPATANNAPVPPTDSFSRARAQADRETED